MTLELMLLNFVVSGSIQAMLCLQGNITIPLYFVVHDSGAHSLNCMVSVCIPGCALSVRKAHYQKGLLLSLGSSCHLCMCL